MSLPKGVVRCKNIDINKTPFLVFQSHPDDYHDIVQRSKELSGQNSNLSKVFFHPKNIDLIQRQIIAEVFRRSRGEYLIEKQNEQDLLVVMRSIFIQFAKHLPYDVKGQIRELNRIVVNEVVPDILSQINFYFGYFKVINEPRQIIDHPKNVSNAGLKTLPSVSRLF